MLYQACLDPTPGSGDNGAVDKKDQHEVGEPSRSMGPVARGSQCSTKKMCGDQGSGSCTSHLASLHRP